MKYYLWNKSSTLLILFFKIKVYKGGCISIVWNMTRDMKMNRLTRTKIASDIQPVQGLEEVSHLWVCALGGCNISCKKGYMIPTIM